MPIEEHTPYLIEPTKSGAYRIKRGRYKKSLYGGSVRWTLMQECGTLEEAAKLIKASNQTGEQYDLFNRLKT